MDDTIADMAEDLISLAPLPDITKLQKLINRFYLKCRILGIPQEATGELINSMLQKHGITKAQLLNNQK